MISLPDLFMTGGSKWRDTQRMQYECQWTEGIIVKVFLACQIMQGPSVVDIVIYDTPVAFPILINASSAF